MHEFSVLAINKHGLAVLYKVRAITRGSAFKKIAEDAKCKVLAIFWRDVANTADTSFLESSPMSLIAEFNQWCEDNA
jgi:hypothetical protein